MLCILSIKLLCCLYAVSAHRACTSLIDGRTIPRIHGEPQAMSGCPASNPPPLRVSHNTPRAYHKACIAAVLHNTQPSGPAWCTVVAWGPQLLSPQAGRHQNATTLERKLHCSIFGPAAEQLSADSCPGTCSDIKVGMVCQCVAEH